MAPRFSTALRTGLREKIEALDQAAIVIGIPSFHSGAAVTHVITTVARGLEKHYRGRQALILVSDGGSTQLFNDQAEVFEQMKEYLRTIWKKGG